MEILGKKQAATGCRRRRQHYRIPNSNIVISRKFSSSEQNWRRSLNQRKGVLPVEYARARLFRGPLCFANEDVKQFPQHLDRHKSVLRVEAFDYREGCLLQGSTIDSLRVNQHVGVKSSSQVWIIRTILRASSGQYRPRVALEGAAKVSLVHRLLRVQRSELARAEPQADRDLSRRSSGLRGPLVTLEKNYDSHRPLKLPFPSRLSVVILPTFTEGCQTVALNY